MNDPLRTHGRRILLAAVLLMIVILAISVRRTAMDTLFTHVDTPPDTSAADIFAGPQSVIAINIDPENNSPGVIDVTPPPPPPPPPTPTDTDTARVRPEKEAPQDTADLNLDDILDRPSGPRPTSSRSTLGAVPPRPIEITWPETRQLKECIGQSVSVRIRVSEKGAVKEARVVPSNVMAACTEAALDAAKHIRFEPGRQGGVAVEMWTEVRIDFQQRD